MRAILFDFDGVVVDDSLVHLQLNERLLVEEGLAPEIINDTHYVSLSDREMLVRALERSGRPSPPELLSRLVARKAVYYQECIQRDGYPVVEAARLLITNCADQGWMLGVVASRRRAEVDGALAQLRVSGLMKTVVTSDEVPGSSVGQAWLSAFRELNAQPPLPARLLHPHEVVAVAKGESSLRSAASWGFVTVGLGACTHDAGLSLRAATVADLEIADLRRL